MVLGSWTFERCFDQRSPGSPPQSGCKECIQLSVCSRSLRTSEEQCVRGQPQHREVPSRPNGGLQPYRTSWLVPGEPHSDQTKIPSKGQVSQSELLHPRLHFNRWCINEVLYERCVQHQGDQPIITCKCKAETFDGTIMRGGVLPNLIACSWKSPFNPKAQNWVP